MFLCAIYFRCDQHRGWATQLDSLLLSFLHTITHILAHLKRLHCFQELLPFPKLDRELLPAIEPEFKQVTYVRVHCSQPTWQSLITFANFSNFYWRLHCKDLKARVGLHVHSFLITKSLDRYDLEYSKMIYQCILNVWSSCWLHYDFKTFNEIPSDISSEWYYLPSDDRFQAASHYKSNKSEIKRSEIRNRKTIKLFIICSLLFVLNHLSGDIIVTL